MRYRCAMAPAACYQSRMLSLRCVLTNCRCCPRFICRLCLMVLRPRVSMHHAHPAICYQHMKYRDAVGMLSIRGQNAKLWPTSAARYQFTKPALHILLLCCELAMNLIRISWDIRMLWHPPLYAVMLRTQPVSINKLRPRMNALINANHFRQTGAPLLTLLVRLACCSFKLALLFLASPGSACLGSLTECRLDSNVGGIWMFIRILFDG